MNDDANREAVIDPAAIVSIADALRAGREYLAAARTDSPGLDAEVLLRHVLGIDRTSFLTRRADLLPTGVWPRYASLLSERAQGVPIAYLTGVREFMGHPFAVRPGVLIPRPETEILVEWAIAWIEKRGPVTIVDVGAGSGAIALSLAAALGPDWTGKIIASDVSPTALAVAAANRERLGLADRVELVQGSLLEWTIDPFDLVLANLPYLTPGQIADNPDLAAEPRLALDGGAGGLQLIAALLRDASRVMGAGGAIGLEIDPNQATAVVAFARASFPGSAVRTLRDLAGRNRHVIVDLSV